jgi:hypothetical protein
MPFPRIIILRTVGTAPRGRPYPTIGQCPAIENGQAQGPVPTGLLSLSNTVERFELLTTRRSNATQP